MKFNLKSMAKILLDFLGKKQKEVVKINTYYFGEFYPYAIDSDLGVFVKNTQRCEKPNEFYSKMEEGILTITADTLLDKHNGKLLAVRREIDNIFKIGDSTTMGIITGFPTKNNIVYVEFDRTVTYQLDVLIGIIAPLFCTEDGVIVQEMEEELHIFSLSELRSGKLRADQIYPHKYVTKLFTNANSYKIFKSRQKLSEYVEEYMKTNNAKYE